MGCLVFMRVEQEKPSSKCFGGIMVGIDMSRAFDTLARDVLLRSLQHAGVDDSLQRILIGDPRSMSI